MTATNGAKIQAQLAQEFTNGEVRQFQGRGGQTFDYIEDETVMDRLDEVLGIGSWSVNVEAISVADGIVKVSLEAIVDGKGVVFQDFGYATRTDGEALKEAVSDGIRRCGRFLGVGRYLYKKHPVTSTGRADPPPARPAARSSEPEFAPDEWDEVPTNGADNSECPIHHVKWNGEWGDLWHKDPEGRYCRHPENTRQEGRRTVSARR